MNSIIQMDVDNDQNFSSFGFFDIYQKTVLNNLREPHG